MKVANLTFDLFTNAIQYVCPNNSIWTNIRSSFQPLISFSLTPSLISLPLWHFASDWQRAVESMLGLTRCLCLTHRELWNTETHWLHSTLGIRLPCSAWYNRAICFALCTSCWRLLAALRGKKNANCSDAVNNLKNAI